jgi:hypothetical protein
MKRSLIVILALAILSLGAFAVPNQLTYSGRLLQNGALVNSTLTMTFKIWTDLTAGSLLWSTANISVPVNQGIYSVVLDQVSPNVFVTDNAYLEVIIDPAFANETLSPRTKINSVGYALQAGGLSIGGIQAVAVSTNGYVGIGTVAPIGLLQVKSNSDLASELYLTGDTGIVGAQGDLSSLWFGGVDAADSNYKAAGILAYSDEDFTTTSGPADLIFLTTPPGSLTASERMRINKFGNVGIGIYPQNANLHLGAGNDSLRIGATGFAGSAADQTTYGLERSRNQILFSTYRDVEPNRIGAKIAGVNKQTYVTGAVRHYVQSTDLAFFTVPPDVGGYDNTLERLRITDQGNVGIGTSLPANARLQVVGPGGLCNLMVPEIQRHLAVLIYILPELQQGPGSATALQFNLIMLAQ